MGGSGVPSKWQNQRLHIRLNKEAIVGKWLKHWGSRRETGMTVTWSPDSRLLPVGGRGAAPIWGLSPPHLRLYLQKVSHIKSQVGSCGEIWVRSCGIGGRQRGGETDGTSRKDPDEHELPCLTDPRSWDSPSRHTQLRKRIVGGLPPEKPPCVGSRWGGDSVETLDAALVSGTFPVARRCRNLSR